MRMVFGVLSLLMVVVIVGVLARKQIAPARPTVPTDSSAESGVVRPSGTPQQQVQQVKQSLESAMQQARPMPDDESK